MADVEEARFWKETVKWFGKWYYVKGECLEGLQRFGEAVEVYSTGIAELGSFHDKSGWLARLYLQRAVRLLAEHRSDEAIADLAKLLELDPSYVGVVEAWLDAVART